MEVKLRSKMSHWPKIPHRYAGVRQSITIEFAPTIFLTFRRPWILAGFVAIQIFYEFSKITKYPSFQRSEKIFFPCTTKSLLIG